MARREVLEVTCDRCGKKDLQDKREVSDEKEVSVTFRGQTKEYDDLCVRCRSACEGYFNRIAKIEDDKKAEPEQKPETPKEPEQPKKRSFLGGK